MVITEEKEREEKGEKKTIKLDEMVNTISVFASNIAYASEKAKDYVIKTKDDDGGI